MVFGVCLQHVCNNYTVLAGVNFNFCLSTLSESESECEDADKKSSLDEI